MRNIFYEIAFWTKSLRWGDALQYRSQNIFDQGNEFRPVCNCICRWILTCSDYSVTPEACIVERISMLILLDGSLPYDCMKGAPHACGQHFLRRAQWSQLCLVLIAVPVYSPSGLLANNPWSMVNNPILGYLVIDRLLANNLKLNAALNVQLECMPITAFANITITTLADMFIAISLLQ